MPGLTREMLTSNSRSILKTADDGQPHILDYYPNLAHARAGVKCTPWTETDFLFPEGAEDGYIVR